MDFTLTPDQRALMAALEGLAARFQAKPIEFRGMALVSEELGLELERAEFFDIASTPGLGPVAAVLAVERLARLPFAAEVALSMLVRPHLPGPPVPRPLCLIEDGRPGRFAATARTLLVARGEELAIARVEPGVVVEPADAIYAYPMGQLTAAPAAVPLPSAEAAGVRKWLRVAVAAETAGLLQAGIDATVEHVSERKQFGRPLGTFQALRHRLAECAVLAGGVRLLALRAAATGDDGDAALAALHAQESATHVVYDLHQMLGAMGVTLEHPLHLWTYRLKALLSELGGRGAQASVAADRCFVGA